MPAVPAETAPVPVAAVLSLADPAPFRKQARTPTDTHLHKQIQFSIALSATRCLLTYVVVPVLSPLLGPELSHNPRIAIPLSVTALVFDGRAVRSVGRSEHRWRWKIVTAYALLIVGIVALLAHDFWYMAR
jgi:hypothetical protein